MQTQAQTAKHVADAAAGTTAVAALLDQAPNIAALLSALWFAMRIGEMVVGWFRRRRGNCPTCGDH